MDRNFKLYRAAAHALEAAKYLIDIEDQYREKLLTLTSDILDKIEIDEEEIERVEEYGDRLRKELGK